MNKYFTIGNISKLFQIPIKTLRYYDEIDLLKPAFIDTATHYRYYSIDQFVVIDIIKNSALMGMTLKEIKHMIQSPSSIEDITSILENQIDLFDSKIAELLRLKNSMEKLKDSIAQSMAVTHNEVFVAFNEERKYISYPFISHNIEEQEINFRKALMQSETINREIYSTFGVGTSYKKYIEDGILINPDIRYYITQESSNQSYEILPQGHYASIIFEDNSFNKEKYYRHLLTFIQSNDLKTEGDFSETWIIPRVDENSRESTLVKLEIKINI